MGGMGCDKLQVLQWSEENGFSWSVKAGLPNAWRRRTSAASVLHEGEIWVIGGSDHSIPTSSVVIYDIEAESWATGPVLPRAASGPRATTLNDEVHVISQHGCWVRRNAAWVEVPGGPVAMFPACVSSPLC